MNNAANDTRAALENAFEAFRRASQTYGETSPEFLAANRALRAAKSAHAKAIGADGPSRQLNGPSLP